MKKIKRYKKSRKKKDLKTDKHWQAIEPNHAGSCAPEKHWLNYRPSSQTIQELVRPTSTDKIQTIHWAKLCSDLCAQKARNKKCMKINPKEDHNEREFKRQIIYWILDLLKKPSKTREAPI